ncbi:PREDICTED: protein HGH1 homolog [Priapulus caudatus]|uniref:Protein HGH1 homolog n=1 Tax=Priapulus caudatus TaxID=37621 RepID=A0ABM1ER86_PRICU|nr:PREDICTED: protein HGH1 homolog [Priapulus caudatus]
MDSLPVELQYLPEDKQREPDDDVRKMILEALTQLCATKPGREYMKSKNTYVVLRALDGWEKSPSVRHVLENLIQIFIGDDPEPDMENLHKVEIPDDVKEKLKTWDEEDNKRIAEEETEYNSVNQQL